jgi:hypothetical protein
MQRTGDKWPLNVASKLNPGRAGPLLTLPVWFEGMAMANCTASRPTRLRQLPIINAVDINCAEMPSVPELSRDYGRAAFCQLVVKAVVSRVGKDRIRRKRSVIINTVNTRIYGAVLKWTVFLWNVFSTAESVVKV